MSHLLMYNEIPVMQFDVPTHTTIVYHRSMLPYAMDPDNCSYSDVVKFCADRVLTKLTKKSPSSKRSVGKG